MKVLMIMPLLVMAMGLKSYAQRENVWTFGYNVLLDFNRIQNGYPTPGRQNLQTMEGCASVCDSTGALLFYTNGSIVYNRNHDVLLNGNIFPTDRTSSTTQGALIVPMPGEQLYYIFSLTQSNYEANNYFSSLYYSVVDIRLDGGLGGIVSDKKAIYIDTGFSEQLTSIPGLKGDVWVIASKHIRPTRFQYNVADTMYSIWSYNVTATGGLNTTPVVTSGLPNKFYYLGSLTPSPDYQKLADTRGGITIYKFDRRSGVPHSPMSSPGLNYSDSIGDFRVCHYGAAFSPNSRFLYASYSFIWNKGVDQIDLSHYHKDSIFSSRVKVFNEGTGSLKLGPDGKIYVLESQGPISVIEKPNEKGIHATALSKALPVLEGSTRANFPNIINMPGIFAINNKVFDTCISFWPHLLKPTHPEGEAFEWSTGDTTATLPVPESGVYWVRYMRERYYHTDSFYVGDYNQRIVLDITPVASDCFGYRLGKAQVSIPGVAQNDFESFWLNANGDTLSKEKQIDSLQGGNYNLIIRQKDCNNSFPITVDERFSRSFFPFDLVTRAACGADSSGSAYLQLLHDSGYVYQTTWKLPDGSTLQQGGDTLAQLKSGQYQLHIRTAQCDTTVTITVGRITDQVNFDLADTVWCQGHDYTLLNTSDPHYDQFVWLRNGDTLATTADFTYRLAQTGTYEITLLGKGSLCTMAKSQRILVDSAYQNRFATDRTMICQGESINLYIDQEVSQHLYHWAIDGKTYRACVPEQQSIMAFDQPGTHTIRLTTSFRACPDTSYAQQVIVQPIPLVDLGGDTALCAHSPAVLLKNRLANATTAYLYEWNTGSTDPVLTVTHPGQYYLKVSDSLSGCAGEGSIHITKDCYIDIPNAFSPNADGVNDYFFPRQLLSGGILAFHMALFDRWGRKVYETTHATGRGWDGKFNGQEQPNGIYIYQIQIDFDNGHGERHEGNVTLIR